MTKLPKPRKPGRHFRVNAVADAILARGEPLTYEAIAAGLNCTVKQAFNAVRNARDIGHWDHEIAPSNPVPVAAPKAVRRDAWTEEELEILDIHYQDQGPSRLARRLGRTEGAVRYQARERDLIHRRVKEDSGWVPTEEEIRAACREARERAIEQRRREGRPDPQPSARMARDRSVVLAGGH
jgi:hypothetical protein